MAIQTLQLAPFALSDAAYTSWGLAIYNALLAVGLTRTADSGQIDWSSPQVRPTGTSPDTYIGYDIWQFSDAHQAAAPVYIKINYGMSYYAGANSPSNCNMRIQVGQGTNGSGTLTGNLSSFMYVGSGATSGATPSATTYSSYISGASDRLSMSLYHGIGTVTYGLLSIERLKDSSGNPTAQGVSLYNISITTNTVSGQRFHQILPTGGAAFPTGGCEPLVAGITDDPAYGVKARNWGISPSSPNMGYVGYPDLAAVFYYAYSYNGSTNTVLPIEIQGGVHNYIMMNASLAANSPAISLIGSSSANFPWGMGVRFE